MARRKVATTVYITAEQENELKALHARTKVPVAEYIRQGIDLVLAQHRRYLPGQLELDLGDEFRQSSLSQIEFKQAADRKRI